jgi:hypothetical protein
MANRWIEFVKNYAKVNNISYTCAMCEIKTKNLYKPLKKEANKEEKPLKGVLELPRAADPKIFTIKTKKSNPKKKEEEKPEIIEEKDDLIKIDKVRQQLSDEKKKILNDSEEILKRPKRKSKYASLLNLPPEITNKNAAELANLNFTKKRLETNEITFKHCLKTLKDSEKELEELLKERNTENFKAMKRTNPRFKRVLNAIDFNEKEIYRCKNALMGIFNNY